MTSHPISRIQTDLMDKLKTLLIANRGEIAVRIIRTAKYTPDPHIHSPILFHVHMNMKLIQTRVGT